MFWIENANIPTIALSSKIKVSKVFMVIYGQLILQLIFELDVLFNVSKIHLFTLLQIEHLIYHNYIYLIQCAMLT